MAATQEDFAKNLHALAPPTITRPDADADADDPLSRLGIQGDRYDLFKDMVNHTRERGGTLGQFSGKQGCGKTTLLQLLALLSVQQGEITVWRARNPAEWRSFPGPVRIWSDHPIQILRVHHDKNAAPEPWDLPVHTFDGAQDLLNRMEPGVLNVVYAKPTRLTYPEDGGVVEEPTRFWGEFVKRVVERVDARWLSLFIDEVHEVWGDRPQGDDWHHQREVRNKLADFRKSFASLFVATHHYDETDEAILKKFQYHGYLWCARIPRWSVIRNRNLAFSLRPGQAVIESGNFAAIRYPAIKKPPYQVIVRPRTPTHASQPADGEGEGSIE